MKPSATAAMALGATALLLQGCPSAYQRTYNQEMQKLEAQQQAQQQEQERLHAEASKYAAVIYFQTGSAIVDEDGRRQLRWFADQMQPYPQVRFLIQGFADSTGGAAENQSLSDQRAANVAAVLNSMGIDVSRMVVQGFGTNYAAASNATAQGRRNNRRVEVTVQ